MALLLIPGRNHLDSADDALVLVVVTVAIASTGSRIRAFVAALVAAASFDFLLTRPYGSFRISRSADITTEVLFVVVGLLVGELAARGRARPAGRRARAATRSPACTTSASASPRARTPTSSSLPWRASCASSSACRTAASCGEQPSGKGAWIASDGTVRLNPLRWPAATVGLPTQHVELPVRGGGQVVGTFILTPTPATPISHEQCVVAVALADQLGATMATQGTEAEPGPPARRAALRRRAGAGSRRAAATAVGTQHAPERDDQRERAPARCSAAGRTLRPRPADVGVVEEQRPCARGRAARPVRGAMKAAGSGRMCATGGGPPGASARRSRAGAHRAAGKCAATSRPRPSTRPRGAAPGRWVDGTRSTRSKGPPTIASSRPPWPSRNARRSARTMAPKRSRASATGDSLYPSSTV